MTEDTIVEMLENVAELKARGFTHFDIARVLGTEETVVDKIVAHETYRETEAGVLQRQILQNTDIDDNWDKLEQNCVKALAEVTQWNKDPDFMLRAAAVANKAQRRLNDGGRVLQAPAVAGVVTLNMSPTFIENLQINQGGFKEGDKATILEQASEKDEQIHDPEEVKKLLEKDGANDPEKVTFDELFNGVAV